MQGDYHLDVHIVELGHRIEGVFQSHGIHNMKDKVGRGVEYGRYLREYIEPYQLSVTVDGPAFHLLVCPGDSHSDAVPHGCHQRASLTISIAID